MRENATKHISNSPSSCPSPIPSFFKFSLTCTLLIKKVTADHETLTRKKKIQGSLDIGCRAGASSAALALAQEGMCDEEKATVILTSIFDATERFPAQKWKADSSFGNSRWLRKFSEVLIQRHMVKTPYSETDVKSLAAKLCSLTWHGRVGGGLVV